MCYQENIVSFKKETWVKSNFIRTEMEEIPKYSDGESQDLAFAILKLIRINKGG